MLQNDFRSKATKYPKYIGGTLSPRDIEERGKYNINGFDDQLVELMGVAFSRGGGGSWEGIHDPEIKRLLYIAALENQPKSAQDDLNGTDAKSADSGGGEYPRPSEKKKPTPGAFFGFSNPLGFEP
ncbi:hypothetical protein FB451DRAFT_1167877 [Mycena latifolia]|nr:hypothetical protein FB451DRAFT_1167877 [Mycena latifolia]